MDHSKRNAKFGGYGWLAPMIVFLFAFEMWPFLTMLDQSLRSLSYTQPAANGGDEVFIISGSEPPAVICMKPHLPSRALIFAVKPSLPRRQAVTPFEAAIPAWRGFVMVPKFALIPEVRLAVMPRDAFNWSSSNPNNVPAAP